MVAFGVTAETVENALADLLAWVDFALAGTSHMDEPAITNARAALRVVRADGGTDALPAPDETAQCGRLLVGQGDDTYDPMCVLPIGHYGTCHPHVHSLKGETRGV